MIGSHVVQQRCTSKLTLSDIANRNPRMGENNMKEYKVLSQKDRFLAGKFDPEKLEKAINSYAAEGWEVVSVATASIPGLTGTREEMIVVMERGR